MKARNLVSQCSCGGVAPPTLMWVGSNNTIITEGICLGCAKKVQTSVKFSDLITMARELRGERPQPERVPLVPPMAKVDECKWLKEIGVSLE